MAEAAPSQGDAGSAQAGTGAGTPTAQGQGNGQANAQNATGGDAPGAAAKPEAQVPSYRLREEADARRAAQEEAKALRTQLAEQAAHIAELRQQQAATVPFVERMRQALAPEPEPTIPADPLEAEVKTLHERVKAAEEYVARQQRQAEVDQLQARINAAAKTHPISNIGLHAVIAEIRQCNLEKRPANVEAIVKRVSEELHEEYEAHRKSRDVPPAERLVDRIAPTNIPEMPKSFPSTKARLAWMAEHGGTRH